MKVSEALLNELIADNTMVIIKDDSGMQMTSGRWYEDKILLWSDSDASFEFDAERNTAIFQLL